MFTRLYISPIGRCSRKFYWLLGVLPFFIFGVFIGFFTSVLQLNSTLVLVFILLAVWPMLAMQIKRWHDVGLSGWFSVLTFVPYLGVVIGIIIGLIPGKSEDNRFGPDPLNRKLGEQNAL